MSQLSTKSKLPQLIRIARRNLEIAKTTDAVLKIHDETQAMKAAAKRVKASEEALRACEEIVTDVERKLGHLIKQQKETVGLRGPRHSKGGGSKGSRRELLPDAPPTLAEAGIDRKLSARSQKLADLSDDEYRKAK